MDHGQFVLIVMEDSLSPLGGEIGESLDIGYGMIQTSAQSAVDLESAVAFGESQFDGKHHICIIFLRGIGVFFTDRIFPYFLGLNRVKISQGDICPKPDLNQVVIAAVGSNDQIFIHK